MKPSYILDACAMIAYFNDETGAEVVSGRIDNMHEGSAMLLMHKINLLEIYYCFYKERGKDLADAMFNEVKECGIHIIDYISDMVFAEAGRLISEYRISLGDSLLLAQAYASGASVLTCDHHEFDPVNAKEQIVFEWIR